ncbi:MAG: hypothetical protein IPL62_17105 [Caulobacteraceae bacterium]|nr:hypothetical protein [Caulobacteraceae bacterium]
MRTGDADLATWIDANASFPNSMVDRITPAPNNDDIEAFVRRQGSTIALVLHAEIFRQWVIEDRFAAGRPA